MKYEYFVDFIGINRFIPYTVTVGLQMSQLIVIKSPLRAKLGTVWVWHQARLQMSDIPSQVLIQTAYSSPSPQLLHPQSLFWWPHIVFCSRDWIIRIRKKHFPVAMSSKKFERRFVWHPGCHSPPVWNEKNRKNETSLFCCRNLPFFLTIIVCS